MDESQLIGKFRIWGNKLKKKISKILVLVIATMLCFLALPSFSIQKTVVAEDKVKYVLLPATYNVMGEEQTLSKYNIKNENLYNFTPFDFENKKRMKGQSLRYYGGENKEYVNEFITLEPQNNILTSENLALSMWIYFDNIETHDLTLKLVLENGESLSWYFSSQELISLVKKSEYDIDTPYGWNKIYFPLSLATLSSSEILNAEVLSTPSKLDFTYSSVSQSEKISRLSFYDINIEETEDKNNFVVEKQNYSFVSTFFMPEENVSLICQGDSITLPSKNNAILYAWIGEKNIKELESESNSKYQWNVFVVLPSGERESKYDFGDTITFDKIGTYTIYYSCSEVNSEETSSKNVLTSSLTISVGSINAIYFNKSNFSMKVGTTQILDISVSQKLSNCSEVTFEFNEKALDVGFDEDGNICVKAKKTGEYDIKAKVKGTRWTGQEKEYETTLTVTVRKQDKDKYHDLKVIICVILGCFCLGFVICMVISLVKSRKIVVK